jgi:hypothetical protein
MIFFLEIALVASVLATAQRTGGIHLKNTHKNLTKTLTVGEKVNIKSPKCANSSENSRVCGAGRSVMVPCLNGDQWRANPSMYSEIETPFF